MVASSIGITVLFSRLNGPPLDAEPRPEIAPGSSLAALQAEITRRRPALEAERAAIAVERRAIQAERARLDALKQRIDRRRRRGLLPVENQLDQLDTIEYNRRSDALRARVVVFNRRVEAQRQAVDEFNALVGQFNASR
jgi:uncharacterized protein YPO0396